MLVKVSNLWKRVKPNGRSQSISHIFDFTQNLQMFIAQCMSYSGEGGALQHVSFVRFMRWSVVLFLVLLHDLGVNLSCIDDAVAIYNDY